MKILFAASDRDLLACFSALLSSDACEVVTAFDGTQALSLLAAEGFDIAVLDRSIPRVSCKKLISFMKEKKVPVILLTDSVVSSRQLTDEPLPNAFLTYPFDSERLQRVISDILEKTSFSGRLSVFGLDIDIPGFRIADGPSLTAKEIDVLQTLAGGDPAASDEGASVQALNEKFSRIGSKARIRYTAGKGFEMVNSNE